MKLRVDRDILAEAVTWTARSVPARPPVPVLAGVRLEAKGSSLVLASFDYEVSAHCEVAADVEEDGVVLVSGRLLADIAKALPNKPVDLEVEGNKVAVSCGSARFSLATWPAPSDRSPSPPPATTPCRCSPASRSRSRAAPWSSWPPTATAWPCGS